MIITERKIDRLLNTDLSSVNQLKVTTEEFNALNRCEKEVRYKYVMKRIADTETLWTMAIDATAIGIQIYEGKKLFAVWSSKEYGEAFCEKVNADVSCLPITLDDFDEYFTDLIFDDELLMNVFPTINEPIGEVVNINEFTDRLEKELEDYQ